ncbi:hypothetical protein [Clostridium sp. CMCC3677]|uniref:hypothetical protein n=1 Tax=Clostridium sp. CMCC3677 TaxID=2949963 RepID=UPI0013F079F7|nr:hypothetical protein [Clostridium sp. CMCC3677]NFG61325.1 hypothetical protein [Clostridium botulinum]NFQ09204.1 hypothetical protein [Clostridium botulinum]
MITWDEINKVSSIITIGTPIITFILGLKFHKFRRWIEYKRIERNICKNTGVLIVRIGTNDIENQVKLWLRQRKKYKDISDEHIVKVEKTGQIESKDIDDIITDLKNKKIKLQQKGISKVLLFISSPVSVATMIGAELSNDFNVLVYNHTFKSDDKYELWGQLQR